MQISSLPLHEPKEPMIFIPTNLSLGKLNFLKKQLRISAISPDNSSVEKNQLNPADSRTIEYLKKIEICNCYNFDL